MLCCNLRLQKRCSMRGILILALEWGSRFLFLEAHDKSVLQYPRYKAPALRFPSRSAEFEAPNRVTSLTPHHLGTAISSHARTLIRGPSKPVDGSPYATFLVALAMCYRQSHK